METYLLTLKKTVCTVTLVFLTLTILFAQNATDSDLSNTAGSNKNWQEGWWLPALVVLLVIIVFFVYRRRRRSV